MALRTVESLGSLAGKTVIVRCDLNVPLVGGEISDDGRIRASRPMLKYLLERHAKLVLLSHLGRPGGKVDSRYSLKPVANRLAELLGQEVAFSTLTDFDRLASPQLTLLENLRFFPQETSKDAEQRENFAKRLAELGDVFVSDGFGVVHRLQASVYELAKILPSAAGELISVELASLERLSNNPARPYTVVLGGSKVSDKLGVIDNLLPKVDNLLIGGGMLFTFLAAKGLPIGASLVERDQLDTVRRYLSKAEALGVRLVLPEDVVMAANFASDAEYVVAGVTELEKTRFGASGVGLDIGPATGQSFAEIIGASGTVFWNGPMGVFEFDAFASGTRTVAQSLADMDGFAVVGGGDSASAIRTLGFQESNFGHVSTGGGASLEFLEGKSLPGLEVLGWAR